MGVYSDRLKKRGLRHGSGPKRGVLGTGQARKKGVFTAAHTCTGHICFQTNIIGHIILVDIIMENAIDIAFSIIIVYTLITKSRSPRIKW